VVAVPLRLSRTGTRGTVVDVPLVLRTLQLSLYPHHGQEAGVQCFVQTLERLCLCALLVRRVS
jgi:hypothetical protein